MIYPTNRETIEAIRKVASSNLVDIAGGAYSIEEWAKEVIRAYNRGKRRPEAVVLILERWGECYQGAVYITPEDFQQEVS